MAEDREVTGRVQADRAEEDQVTGLADPEVIDRLPEDQVETGR